MLQTKKITVIIQNNIIIVLKSHDYYSYLMDLAGWI